MKNKKVVVIGLDGANKTTASLVGIKNDVYDFISIIPPYTPPSWTSIITGVNPAKHGIIGWQKVSPKSLATTLATSKDVKYPRLPELLSAAGLKSIIINLPMTYPMTWADPKTTIVVSDWASPKQEIFPNSLEEKYKEYLVEPPHKWAEGSKKEYPKKVEEFLGIRMEFYYDLLRKYDWNFYFVVFSEIDWFSHLYPQILEKKNIEMVKPTFKLINKFIEDVTLRADTVFIISDHGFQVVNKVFYLNKALAEKGFIQYSKTKSTVIRKVRDLLPKKVINKVAKKIEKANIISHVTSNVDAFIAEPATWGVYLRDLGKSGAVVKALLEYSEIKDVIPSQYIHKGPYGKYLPHLFAIPESGVEFSHDLKGKTTENTYKGNHELHGVFSAWGDGIKEHAEFNKTPRVYDIAPTILHVFGLPISKDMDGRVLMEIFEKDSEFAKRKPEYVDLNYYIKDQEYEKLKKAIRNIKLKS